MNDNVIRFFNSVSFPIIITDGEDRVNFKNLSAQKFIKSPRRGGSMVPFVDPYGVNILDNDRKIAIVSMFGPSAPFRRALVIYSDDSIRPAAKLWIFDSSLYVLDADRVYDFTACVGEALAPLLIPLLRDDPLAKRIPTATQWKESFGMIYRTLHAASRNYASVSEFFRAPPPEVMASHIRDDVIAVVERAGFSVIYRTELYSSAGRYADYFSFIVLFIRLLFIFISRSVDRSLDVLIRSDDSEISAIISFNPMIPFSYPVNGKTDELFEVLPDDELDIAVIAACIGAVDGCEFSFEAAKERTNFLSARLDMPLHPLPRRLGQQDGFTGPALDDLRTYFKDLSSAIFAKI